MLAHHRLAAIGQIGERNFLVAGAVEDQRLHPLRQLGKGFVDVEAHVLGQTLEQLKIELVAPVPALDGARRQRQLRKGHDALRVEEADRAQAIAARTRAQRTVEREEARLQLRQCVVADGTRELGREQVLAATIHLDRDGAPIAVPQCRFVGLRQPLLELGADAQPIHHHLDRVLGGLGELGHRVDLDHLAIHTHAREPLGPQLDEQLEVLALAIDDHRRQDHETRPLGILPLHRQRGVDHLRDGHRGELLVRVVRTIRIADARE